MSSSSGRILTSGGSQGIDTDLLVWPAGKNCALWQTDDDDEEEDSSCSRDDDVNSPDRPRRSGAARFNINYHVPPQKITVEQHPTDALSFDQLPAAIGRHYKTPDFISLNHGCIRSAVTNSFRGEKLAESWQHMNHRSLNALGSMMINVSVKVLGRDEANDRSVAASATAENNATKARHTMLLCPFVCVC
ncbi:unnamed protein product [Heligmosomoides polygyrus]|uniref:DDE_Tnp_1_7 domain-containing protein n=1 Tax=Heligmosomoides polygyrus TaxID=6339 RepID=A0A183FV33_HELPZ|nr:unnamed protein product [Heligmosomoides polygyrus]